MTKGTRRTLRREPEHQSEAVVVIASYVDRETAKQLNHRAVDLEVSRSLLIEYLIQEFLAGRIDVSGLEGNDG